MSVCLLFSVFLFLTCTTKNMYVHYNNTILFINSCQIPPFRSNIFAQFSIIQLQRICVKTKILKISNYRNLRKICFFLLLWKKKRAFVSKRGTYFCDDTIDLNHIFLTGLFSSILSNMNQRMSKIKLGRLVFCKIFCNKYFTSVILINWFDLFSFH